MLVLVLEPHGAVGSCQAMKKEPDHFSIDYALSYRNFWGVVEGRHGTIDFGTGHRFPTHALTPRSGLARNAGRRVESLVLSFVAVIGEKLRVRVVAKSLLLPWLVRLAAYVLTLLPAKPTAGGAGIA